MGIPPLRLRSPVLIAKESSCVEHSCGGASPNTVVGSVATWPMNCVMESSDLREFRVEIPFETIVRLSRDQMSRIATLFGDPNFEGQHTYKFYDDPIKCVKVVSGAGPHQHVQLLLALAHGNTMPL